MMLVSIHNSSVWADTVSCIDTCSHASIHASEKLTCIDTNMILYRYKRVKTVLCINFHSFIHQTPNTSSSTRKLHQKPSFPNSQSPSKLNQNSQNLTLNHFKFIAHSHSFINIVVQAFKIFTFKTRVFQFGCVWILHFLKLSTR
jgi:hypothetical protein